MSQTLTYRTQDLSRKDFTVAEILDLQDLGVIGEDDNFEPVDGEIVPMRAKTHWHELFKTYLGVAVARALPDESWRLDSV